VDIQGHHRDEAVQQALQELQNYALEVVLLGSYPAAD
jgi:prephenate dehydratase